MQEGSSKSLLHNACNFNYRKHLAHSFYRIILGIVRLGFEQNFWVFSQFHSTVSLVSTDTDN